MCDLQWTSPMSHRGSVHDAVQTIQLTTSQEDTIEQIKRFNIACVYKDSCNGAQLISFMFVLRVHWDV